MPRAQSTGGVGVVLEEEVQDRVRQAAPTAIQMRRRPVLRSPRMVRRQRPPTGFAENLLPHGSDRTRRYLLASRTLGDVAPEELLPEQTRDDIDTEDVRDSADRDRWLRDQVPPHHG